MERACCGMYKFTKLIHAYGPMKKVVIMDINSTIKKYIKQQVLKLKKYREFKWI